MILLDTHMLVWLLIAPQNLSPKAKKTILAMYRKLREMWRAADGDRYCGRQGIDYARLFGDLRIQAQNLW
jgi:hypothetical protein